MNQARPQTKGRGTSTPQFFWDSHVHANGMVMHIGEGRFLGGQLRLQPQALLQFWYPILMPTQLDLT